MFFLDIPFYRNPRVSDASEIKSTATPPGTRSSLRQVDQGKLMVIDAGLVRSAMLACK